MFRLVTSFRNAFHGLYLAWQGLAFRIIVLVAIGVLILVFVFPVSRKEILVLVMISGFVIILEMLNTIIEHLTDMLQPRLHHYVKMIKDMMAGAVLVGSLVGFIAGVIIFGPFFFGT